MFFVLLNLSVIPETPFINVCPFPLQNRCTREILSLPAFVSYVVNTAVMESPIDDRSNESPVSAFDIELQVK